MLLPESELVSFLEAPPFPLYLPAFLCLPLASEMLIQRAACCDGFGLVVSEQSAFRFAASYTPGPLLVQGVLASIPMPAVRSSTHSVFGRLESYVICGRH